MNSTPNTIVGDSEVEFASPDGNPVDRPQGSGSAARVVSYNVGDEPTEPREATMAANGHHLSRSFLARARLALLRYLRRFLYDVSMPDHRFSAPLRPEGADAEQWAPGPHRELRAGVEFNVYDLRPWLRQYREGHVGVDEEAKADEED